MEWTIKGCFLFVCLKCPGSSKEYTEKRKPTGELACQIQEETDTSKGLKQNY